MTIDDARLSSALHELADTPAPAGLADTALAGARRRRRVRAAVTSTSALAVAGILAVPFLFNSGATPAPAGFGAAPSPSPTSSLVLPGEPAKCQLPMIRVDVKEVPQDKRPPYLKGVLEALPPRSDYQVQSGTLICDFNEGRGLEAYAVINLGGMTRPGGHLTVYLNKPSERPKTCAAFAAKHQSENVTITSCQEADASNPLRVTTRETQGTVMAFAVYPDRALWMESHPAKTGGVPVTSAEQLMKVVTSKNLHDQLNQ
ncbi:hypothetical protein [Longispora albida]|uniref:hypothetical protein n=1 Tax=Longispora albida TaxID=203523 RepID=UPI00037BDD2D|nr:hypothetical protein [Longispora albida]